MLFTAPVNKSVKYTVLSFPINIYIYIFFWNVRIPQHQLHYTTVTEGKLSYNKSKILWLKIFIAATFKKMILLNQVIALGHFIATAIQGYYIVTLLIADLN